MSTKIEIDQTGAEAAYDLLSAEYDQFTAHHDYDGWLDSLLPPLEARGLEGDRLLDLGCGTGKSSLPMVERGWKVTACDFSRGMLQRLREKSKGAITIHRADIRSLPKLGEFDLILSLGDVLNYCAVGTPLERSLAGIRKNLAPGGLALFDLNTLNTYRTFYAEKQVVEIEDRRVEWQGQGDGSADPGVMAESVVEISTSTTTATSVHRQAHLSEEEVRAAIETAGLECLDVFGQGFDGVLQQPLREDTHTKAIYITKVRNHEEKRR